MSTIRNIRILIVALFFVALHLHRNFKEEFYVRSSSKLNEHLRSNLQDLGLSARFDENSEEPYVLLHVGPHKTGTTSMQEFLVDAVAQNKSFLRVDDIVVPTIEQLPGRFYDMPMLNFAHCQIGKFNVDGGQMNVDNCKSVLKVFKPFVLESYVKKKNIIIIAEDLDRPTIALKRILFYLSPYKRIRVVATYRRLHDWLPSFYNQIIDLYIGEYAGGREKYPNIVGWLNEKFDKFVSMHGIALAKKYKEIAESVELMNIHEDVDLIENFFCNHVLGGSATCNAIREGAVKKSITNIGKNHDREQLVIEGAIRGKLPFPMGKYDARDFGRRLYHEYTRQNISVSDIPRICPPPTFLEKLLAMELEQEKMFFPLWFEAQGGEEGLQLSFKNAATSKLCAMDVDKILDSGMLDPVFKVLL